MRLYSTEIMTWLAWLECFNSRSILSAHPGRRLPLCPTSTQTHVVKFHTYTGRIINTELDLAPLRKSLRVQQCLNSGAAAKRQADATHTPNRDKVSVEKTASGEATDSIFRERWQGAEIVSIRFFLPFVYCVLLWRWLSLQVERTKPLSYMKCLLHHFE